MFALLQITGANAEIEPSKTFEMLAALAPKFNQILAATALLSKYQPINAMFRNDEFVFATNGNGIYAAANRRTGGLLMHLESMRLDALARHDFERAFDLTDSFERADVRLAARFIILRAVLSDNKTLQNLPLHNRRFAQILTSSGGTIRVRER